MKFFCNQPTFFCKTSHHTPPLLIHIIIIFFLEKMDQMKVIPLNVEDKKVFTDIWKLCEDNNYLHKKEILSDLMAVHFSKRKVDEVKNGKTLMQAMAMEFCGIYDEITNTLIAVAEFHIRDHFAEINITNLLVSEMYRKRHLGTKILQYIENLRTVHTKILSCECHEKSVEAKILLTKFGFDQHSSSENIFGLYDFQKFLDENIISQFECYDLDVASLKENQLDKYRTELLSAVISTDVKEEYLEGLRKIKIIH